MRHLIHTLLLECKLLLDTLLTKWLVLDHHDWLREVLLAQIHLHSVREKGLHRHLLLSFRLFWSSSGLSHIARICVSRIILFT